MRFLPPLPILLWLVAALVAAPSAQTGQPADQPASITVTVNGSPVDAEILVFSNGPKSVASTGADGNLVFDPQLLTHKGVTVAPGTPMTVYRLACEDGKIRLLLAPSSVSQDDLGCADPNKPIVEGQNCGCDPVGTVVWGPGMQVNIPAAAGGTSASGSTAMTTAAPAGMSTGAKVATGVGLGVLVGTAVVVGSTSDDNDTSSTLLSRLTGTYPGTFTQTSTTCSPPRFVTSFSGSVILTVADSGQTTAILRESIDRTYNGALNATGGTLTGSGTFASGTPHSGTLQVAVIDGTPIRINVTEILNAFGCAVTFAGSNLSQTRP